MHKTPGAERLENYESVSAAQPPADAPINPDRTLYVIFHGAVTFYDDQSLPWIDAFIDDLKDDHVYLCGKFLQETRIPAGSQMSLSGVQGGGDCFSNDLSFLFYTGDAGRGGAVVGLDKVYSQIRFPRPQKILRCFNLKNPNPGAAQRYCIVPVFQYSFEQAESLGLRIFRNFGTSCADTAPRPDTFPWSPTRFDPTPLTLHIRGEEETGADQSTRDRDYKLSSSILGNKTPKEDITAFNERDASDDIPPYLDDNRRFWEIYMSLTDRLSWLGSVGARIQRHAPLPGSEFLVQAPSPFKDDNASCGGASGGDGGR